MSCNRPIAVLVAALVRRAKDLGHGKSFCILKKTMALARGRMTVGEIKEPEKDFRPVGMVGKFGRPPLARPTRLHDKGCHTAPAGARAVGLLFLHNIHILFCFPYPI